MVWVLLVGVARTSYAGPRPYLFALDTVQLAQGDFEYEQWNWFMTQMPGGIGSSTWFFLAPVYGVSNRVEVSTSLEIMTLPGPRGGGGEAAGYPGTRLADIGFEARVLLTNPDVASGDFFRAALRPQIQVNMQNIFDAPVEQNIWAGGQILTSYGNPKSHHANINTGILSDALVANGLDLWTMNAGATYKLSEELGLTAEYIHFISIRDIVVNRNRRIYLGPVFSFTRGALWANFGALIGLNDTSATTLTTLTFGIGI